MALLHRGSHLRCEYCGHPRNGRTIDNHARCCQIRAGECTLSSPLRFMNATNKHGFRLIMCSGINLALSLVPVGLGTRKCFPFFHFQGFAFAADFAAVGVICVRWAPLKETG